MNARRLLRLGLLVGLALIPVAPAGGTTPTGVEPAVVNATVPVGGSVTVTKTVHTPAIPPVPDIYFLSDTTGSMGPTIANVQANASSIMNTVLSTQPGAQFGAGNYKDFQDTQDDPWVFKNDARIGSVPLAVAGINSWNADGGGDGPEGWLYALHQIAKGGSTPPIAWRTGSSRVLVWFGDAPAHDPVCTAFSGLPFDLTTGLVASELAAEHIKVIAISLNTSGYPAGMNGSSTLFESDYDLTCGTPTGRTGQAAEIAAATGGSNLFAASPADVSDTILGALANLPITVTPVPVCDPGLTATYDAATQTVTSGTDAHFQETFDVNGSAQSGVTLHCTVDFLLNGLSQPGFQQTANITVPAQTGTIVVKKRTVPAGDTTTFNFTGDAAGPVAGDGGTITAGNIPAGTYTSTETALPGWDLTDLSCDDSNSTGDVSTRTATFHLAAGETVTCTFTNTKRATISLRKVTNPSPDPANTLFAFSGHPSGLTANGGTLSESVPPGTYTSTETALPGWDLTGLACDDSNSTGNLGTRTATFVAAPGENVTCTFTNTKRGSIIVKKRTVPAGDTTNFSFTGDAAGTVAGDGGSITVGNLAPGTYTSTETALAGWDLTGLSCDDSDSTGSVVTGTATFRLAAGETVTCTFTNAKRGSIVVRKRTLPAGDPTKFAFTGDAAGSIADGDSITVGNLAPGTYTSTETALAGWDLTSLTCDDSDSSGSLATRTATFKVAAGETVTCTFTNTKRATIFVRKITQPSPDPASTLFSFSGHPSGITVNGGTLSESVAPGTYASTEAALPGWDLTSLKCDDSDSTGNLVTRTATFVAAPGETVTCTFTNTKRGSIIVRSKTLPAGDTTAFAFSGDAAGPIATDGGTITVGNLVPGTYTSTESALAGWDLTGLACDDSDSTGNLGGRTATFRVAAGETVTCTFTNTKRGSIVVKKRTLPAGDTTNFNFTGDAAGTVAGDGGTLTVANIVPGTYTSTETALAGWNLTALACDDSDSTGSIPARTATFRLAPGETVTCTFTNTKAGRIVVKNKTLPAGDTSTFTYSGDAAGPIATDGGTITVGNLAPGTYTSTESALAGWDLSALTCDDSDSTGSLAARTATFRVAAGETVTCTFTNTNRATIFVRKITSPSPDPLTTLFSFSGHPSGITANGGTLSESVVPGTYASTEAAVAGWDLTGLACDDSDSTGSLVTRTATFVAAPGETVTCTFTNTKRGSIIVKNRTVPAGDNSTFAFTGDAAGPIAGDGGTITVGNLVPGTYTSAESALAGWDLTGLVCDDSDSTGSLATRTATFRVAAGETVTCTFTNTKRATLLVRKVTSPSPDPLTTLFAFSGHPAGLVGNGGTLSESVVPGTYASTEAAVAGWDLTGLICNDSDSTGSLVTRTTTFVAAPGETVTCTFTNTKRGSIVVKSKTLPAGDNTTFTFGGDAAGPISGDGGTITVGNLAPGTYTSTESALAGWDLSGLTCDDSDSTGSLVTRTATFRVAPGENVTCTFTNSKRGSIVVKSRTLPAGSTATFNFAGDAAGSVATDGGTISVGNLVPGTYTSTESALTGWDLTALTCDDGDSTGNVAGRTATFRVAAGETVTCTFTNTKRGAIVVKTRTVPAGDSTTFTYSGDAAGTVPGDGGTISISNLVPGTYTSTQSALAGWDLTALACDDSDSTGSPASGTATFRVGPGENVTCTFTNTKRARVVLRNVTVPSPDASNAQFAFAGHPAGTIGNGGTLSETLVPGTYTAVETLPAGWDLTGLACDDSDSTANLAARTATFVAAPGETVTCTFTDTKRATLVVKQLTVPSPDPSGTAFVYTGHPAGSIVNGGTTSETLAPGTYTATQAVPSGWDVTGVTCDDSDSTGSVANRNATFAAAPGETVTCTFTDSKRATLVVKQVTVPSPDASNTQFAFAGHPAGTAGNGQTTTETLAAGTYTSTQTVPNGWDLTGLTCDDSDSTGSVSAKTATFRAAPGETVTCTFTDTKRTQIIVKQLTLPTPDLNNTPFAFTGHPAGTIGFGGTISEFVVPGTYTSTAQVPSGWDLTALTCDDSDSTGNLATRTATFVAAAGEVITCTFTDTQRGKVVVRQVTNPSPDSTVVSYTGHPAGTAVNGGTLSETVVPGTYASIQTVPSGYGLSSIVCDDTNSVGVVSSRTASFNVSPGETVTCTFTDTKLPSACVVGYPTGNPPTLQSVVFNESDVLAAAALLPSQVAVWYTDEHALTLGIRQVAVTAKVGGSTITTTTNYPITAEATNPGHATFPQVGTTQLGSGTTTENPFAGTDSATWSSTYGTIDNGRPMWPAMFVTDTTTNPANRSGDWQQGGLPAVPPSDVFGTWKAAVKTDDQTTTAKTGGHPIVVTPDDDPARNNWTLGPGSDTPPGGFGAYTNGGYGAEVRWNLSALGLQAGHTYRLEFMVHDGDQNKAGGDSGVGCFNVFIPS